MLNCLLKFQIYTLRSADPIRVGMPNRRIRRILIMDVVAALNVWKWEDDPRSLTLEWIDNHSDVTPIESAGKIKDPFKDVMVIERDRRNGFRQ